MERHPMRVPTPALTPEDIARMSPQVVEMVRHYTSPLSPAWGKKKLAAELAGLKPAAWHGEQAQILLRDAIQHRLLAGKGSLEAVQAYQMEAAMALVASLHKVQEQGPAYDIHAEMEREDQRVAEAREAYRRAVEEDDESAMPGKSELYRDREKIELMLAHNRNVVAGLKEVRQVAEKILGYAVGLPGHTREQEEARRPGIDLSRMSEEELSQLMTVVHSVLDGKKKGTPSEDGIPTVEAEVVGG